VRAPRYPTFTYAPLFEPKRSRMRSLVGAVLLAPGYFAIWLLEKWYER